MSFSRSFLKATGLSDEQISAVMEEHTAVTDALKKQRDDYKQEADKAADLQKQLDGLQGGDDYKQKYEDEHHAFEDFKKKTAQDAEAAKIRTAYRKLLTDEKIGEKWLDRIIKGTDFSGIKLDKDGNLADLDKLKETIDKEWGDVKTTVTQQGAKVETPPQAGKATKTKQEIMEIKDTAERQKAIAENHELFGF